MATLSLVESAGAFVETIEKSGLLSADGMAKVRDAAAKAESPMALARALVKEGTLTKWQANQLLYGISQFIVGKYKLIDQLGAGEMGRVFLAEHVQMGRRHSLKVLSRRHVSKPDVLKRFLEEAQQVCALDHRNLSHIYDVNQDGDRYYLVMEFVEGQDLQRMVSKSGKLTVQQAVDYARQTAEGLAHAHESKVVHGDLKPSNLLIDSGGTVKILEIGQARLTEGPAAPMGQDETVEAASLAAAIHHAPEQRGNVRTIDHRSDIYSLGSVLCFLLTGKAAPDAAEAQKLLEQQSQVPPELTQLCVRLMAENPEDRPATMQAVLDELATIASEQPPAPKSKANGAKPPVGGNGKEKSGKEKPDKATGEKAKPDKVKAEKEKSDAPPPKAKKPPVAKALAESDSNSITEAEEEPAASAEEDAAPFAGFSIKTKGRIGAHKAPVKAKAAAAPAAAATDEDAADEPKQRSYLPLIIGGSVGAGVLALAGIALLVFFLFFRGGDADTVADASKAAKTEAQSAEAATPAAEAGSDKEINPAEVESNPNIGAESPAATTPAVTKSAPPTANPAAPVATAAKTPETPKSESPQPAEAPMPTPTPATTPAESSPPPPDPAKTPDPPTPPADPAKPPESPMPAAAPATPADSTTPANPLEGFAKAVALPKLGSGAGDIPPEALEAKVLGPCKVDPSLLVIAHLKGGEFAARGGRQKFEMTATNGTAKQDWEVSLVGGESPVLIAKLGVKDGNLMFQWTPEAAREPNAPFLSNCALELRAGASKEPHTVALREAVIGPPLGIDVERQAQAKWLVENLPDPKSIHFEVAKLDGIPRQRYEPEEVIRGAGEEITIWTGPGDEAMFLGLKIDSAIVGKNLQITSQPWVKFEGMKKPEKYSKKDLAKFKLNAAPALNRLTQGVNALANAKDEPSVLRKSEMTQQIEALNKSTAQIDELTAFAEAIQGMSAIHFRVYYLAEESTQVDLLVTEGAPSEKK